MICNRNGSAQALPFSEGRDEHEPSGNTGTAERNIPYEMTALLVSDNYIQAVFAGGIQQSPYVMAMYSTQDKLHEALDMLDRRCVGMGDAIFRFPKDGEI